MRAAFDPHIQVRFDGVEPSRTPLADGSTVDVEILARSSDGTLRVRVAGKTLVASSSNGLDAAGYLPGDSFQARVRLSSNAVFLDPLRNPAAERANILSRLSLPDTPEAAFLVRFLARSLFKLDTPLCRSILAVSARFPGRERRAVEAAAILASHGIGIDDDTVAGLMDAIEGGAAGGDASGGDARGEAGESDGADDANYADDANGDTDDTDDNEADGAARRRIGEFIAFINHKKAHERHWIVIPFSRELAGARARGSVRCLIDLVSARCLETLVTVHDGERVWDFDFAGVRCEFRANPPFPSVKSGEFAVYLRGILESAGYTEAYPSESSGDFSRGISGIDLEA